MSALHNIAIFLFVVLVFLNIFFYFSAANNTIEGKAFFPHGFNIYKLSDESLYTKKGNIFRKLAIYCWIIELPLFVIMYLTSK